MTLASVLSTAMSGLAVAQQALNVTAHNVANVNTEGYSRQLAYQEAVIVDGRGAGARAADTTRVVDELLGGRILQQQGRLGRSEALGEAHSQIQDRLLGSPGDDSGLSARISGLATAAEALAGDPAKAALAVGFIGAAQDLTQLIAQAGAEVQSLRRELDQDIAGTVAAINDEIEALHRLNGEIARGGATPDLLDRRDALLESLGGRIEISVTREENGTIAVYTRSGQPLLEHAPRQLAYEPAATVGAGTVFGPIRLFDAAEIDPASGQPAAGATGTVLVTGGVRAALTPELRADGIADVGQTIASPFQAGRLQGLLEARDRLLPGLADQLGELAGLVRHTLNAAHNAAVPQPPPNSLLGTRTDTSGFAAAVRSGTAWLAVVDSGTGAAVSTIAIDLAAAADPADLAAQITSDLGPYGSASLKAAGALEIALAPGYGVALAEGDSAITATDAAGHSRTFGFSHYFGLNDLIVTDGGDPTRLAVRPDIVADSTRLSRAQLDVTAGAVSEAKLGGAGDDRGARRLAAAFETSLATVARGSLPAGTYRIADYAAEIVAAVSVTAGQAEEAEKNDRALAEDLATRRAAVSGVNLDEELSRLVLYQQAYSVSARLVSITNELFDDLLAIGR